MKAFKILVGLLITVIVIAVIVVTIFISQINAIVKEVIETVGSDALHTPVTVDKVDIKLKEGEGTISGISVANPSGFSTADMLQIGNVGLHIDTSSVGDEVLVLKKVFVNGVTFLAEHKNLTDTNVQKMIDHISSGKSKPSVESKQSSSTSDSGDKVRLMIESLQVGSTEVTLLSDQYGTKNFTIPSYNQNNIGDKQRGLSPEELSKAVVANLLKRIKMVLSDRIKNESKDRLKGKLKSELDDKLKDKIDTGKLKSLFQ